MYVYVMITTSKVSNFKATRKVFDSKLKVKSHMSDIKAVLLHDSDRNSLLTYESKTHYFEFQVMDVI